MIDLKSRDPKLANLQEILDKIPPECDQITIKPGERDRISKKRDNFLVETPSFNYLVEALEEQASWISVDTSCKFKSYLTHEGRVAVAITLTRNAQRNFWSV